MARENSKPKKQRRKKDPEGRMALGEHLIELRNRLMLAAGAVLLCSVVGWIFYNDVFSLIEEPFNIARKQGHNTQANLGSIGSPLDLKLRLAAYVGLLLSSPFTLWQVWGFILPGLRKKERRYALGFFLPGVVLFAIGLAAGFWVMTKAVPVLQSFSPISNVSNIIDFGQYLSQVIRTMLVFGVAFMLPDLLVLLNFLGVLRGRTMLKAWRWVVFVCFAFTAVMVPTPDPFTMIFMALPMVLFYFVAVLISIRNDKRRDAREASDLDDDTPSTIDDEVESVEAPERLDRTDEK